MKNSFLCFFYLMAVSQACFAQVKPSKITYSDFDIITGQLSSKLANHVNETNGFYYIKKNRPNCIGIFRKSAVKKREYNDKVKTFCFDKDFRSFTTNKIRIKFVDYLDSGFIVQNKIYRTRVGYYSKGLFNKENTIFEIIDSANAKLTNWIYLAGIDSITQSLALINFNRWEADTTSARKIIFYYTNLSGFWEIKSCEGIEDEECSLYKMNYVFQKLPSSIFWLMVIR